MRRKSTMNRKRKRRAIRKALPLLTTQQALMELVNAFVFIPSIERL